MTAMMNEARATVPRWNLNVRQKDEQTGHLRRLDPAKLE